MNNISCVHPHDVGLLWPRIVPLVEEILQQDSGEYEVHDVYVSLMQQEMQLWLATRPKQIDAIMLTQILCFPRKRYLFIVGLAGGPPDLWLDGWPVVESWAIQQGLNGVRAPGRPGWERHPAMRECGLKKRYVVYGSEFVTRGLQ